MQEVHSVLTNLSLLPTMNSCTIDWKVHDVRCDPALVLQFTQCLFSPTTVNITPGFATCMSAWFSSLLHQLFFAEFKSINNQSIAGSDMSLYMTLSKWKQCNQHCYNYCSSNLEIVHQPILTWFMLTSWEVIAQPTGRWAIAVHPRNDGVIHVPSGISDHTGPWGNNSGLSFL